MMMKNILLEQKVADKNAIDVLRDEVSFLKNEIQHKNKVITLLLDDIKMMKNKEKRKEKTKQNEKANKWKKI